MIKIQIIDGFNVIIATIYKSGIIVYKQLKGSVEVDPDIPDIEEEIISIINKLSVKKH